jgi:hypothetical protein
VVAVIKTGHSILRLLNYNENKIKEGAAAFLGAQNYPIDGARLTFQQKLNRLKNQAALNENVTRNSMHISLNFDPSEKLDGSRLQEIAEVYMDKIGLADLPYLVYQHFDAGHPHIHIVSVKVRADGRRVETQNIGKNQSEKARLEIEKAYRLVPAKSEAKVAALRIPAVNAERVQYGRSQTARAIGNVLQTVLYQYKYASLPELNAVLKQFNIAADRGNEDSRIFLHRGLVYRVLDNAGNKVGPPIKASYYYDKPGLSFLEKRYAKNELGRVKDKPRVRNMIDLALLNKRVDLNKLAGALKKEGIDMVLRRNEHGVIYGITYVDHMTKAVFNGSALGKAYSANAIRERCSGVTAGEEKNRVVKTAKVPFHKDGQKPFAGADQEKDNKGSGILETLMDPGYPSENMDWQLKRSKRKKKRRQVRPE